jgi:hypothetical protein
MYNVNTKISKTCCQSKCKCKHEISVNDVVNSIKKLKKYKHDGFYEIYSDHVKNGTDKLHYFIADVFNALLIHGCQTDDLLTSVLIPIPKSLRKSINDSDNYRAIALGSILGKMFDLIILEKEKGALVTSQLQFGFKNKSSTTQCSFVANEIINHYANNEIKCLHSIVRCK